MAVHPPLAVSRENRDSIDFEYSSAQLSLSSQLTSSGGAG